MQGGVGIAQLSAGCLFGTALEILHDIRYRLQRASQVPNLILLQMGVLQTYTADALAHVEEILHGEVVGLLLQPTELTYLCEPLVDHIELGGEGNLVNLFLAQRAQTALSQQTANLVESYLLFEVVWVNHAAKVLKLCDNIGVK